VYVASESTFYRILRSDFQQHHRGRARKPMVRPISTHRATGPNQLWSWDITWLPSSVKGQYFYWYMVLDVFSRKIVAHEVHEEESAHHAGHLMRRASLAEARIGKPLVLHSDNGSAMRGSTMLATLENLGVAASFSRPRVSNDNAYAESLFRTCKYRPDYPRKPFADATAARAWMHRFVQWYNNVHKHSGLKFVTPSERHGGKADEILAKRRQVYATAREQVPRRWTRGLRDWDLDAEVWLNPERTIAEPLMQSA
jgi:transposase InsO family protein